MSSLSRSASSPSRPSASSRPAGLGRSLSANLENIRSEVISDSDGNGETQGRRASLLAVDRKRRLTATGQDDPAAPRRQPILTGGDPGSSRRADLQRPLPTLPSSGDVPGSSRATAIDLSSSPPPPPPPDSPSRQHSESTPTRQRLRDDIMEYILPRWQPDSEVTHCPICGTQFNFWYRKHHCRKCGRVVCASCSPHRITIPRQFIVRPPDQNRRRSTGAESSAQVVDLTWDDSPQSSSNPALGGGEEVRLCNPCVPDPNPDPPIGYGAIRSGLDRLSDSNWGATLPALPSSHPRHRAHHSLSRASQFYGQRPDMEAESDDRRGESRTGNSGEQFSPSRYGLPYDYQQSPPAYSTSRGQAVSDKKMGFRSDVVLTLCLVLDPSVRPSWNTLPGWNFRLLEHTTQPGAIFMDPERPRHAFRSQRPPIDERDLCPICSQPLPPRGSDGNEEAREAHIRDCIENSSRGARSPPPRGSPSSHAPHPMRMLSFTATEKDCVNEDGSAQECTICMEEYEVGESLARLECLCKFHKSCIVEWFERKKECPVHKVL
ncbi:hypothetical protein T310_3695 [Rasamsonia emersonii CBS 393.64]|uniref:FYVE zinc finger protein n=1 Tax=Rasamsonia emersonii (strain ATCC 16479 / CBS 393.64 / IMI 116815) TaxID=1408163 RepID=A0A0F4YVZ5_RASE3|nr:hypothetical protein T310_3695 [Rasamsonia emersonii CBS 393.64]KKA22260.1 hypothetical protein T310_3695 [Rasamsonia emersonii CBS 393.64]